MPQGIRKAIELDPVLPSPLPCSSGDRPGTSLKAAMSESRTSTSHRKVVKPKRRFTIHWLFRWVAWLLVVLCVAASLFFLIAYAIQFGNDKTYQWLSSTLIREGSRQSRGGGREGFRAVQGQARVVIALASGCSPNLVTLLQYVLLEHFCL